uniref:Uncharacterized protein n=1 Tax=Glossina brevipalpis TaxID=37001 RepID=A0A1A9WV57_9MUSC
MPSEALAQLRNFMDGRNDEEHTEIKFKHFTYLSRTLSFMSRNLSLESQLAGKMVVAAEATAVRRTVPRSELFWVEVLTVAVLLMGSFIAQFIVVAEIFAVETIGAWVMEPIGFAFTSILRRFIGFLTKSFLICTVSGTYHSHHIFPNAYEIPED